MAWCALALLLPIPLAAQQASPVAAPQVVAQPVTPPSTPPVPTPPVLNRANEALPAWLRVRGEFRERIEGFDGLGFNDTREDLYYLSRLRLNATITLARLLS